MTPRPKGSLCQNSYSSWLTPIEVVYPSSRPSLYLTSCTSKRALTSPVNVSYTYIICCPRLNGKTVGESLGLQALETFICELKDLALLRWT
jgi:hypothetical protein